MRVNIPSVSQENSKLSGVKGIPIPAEMIAAAAADLTCRSCNQGGVKVMMQPTTRRTLVLVHCMNRDCALCGATREVRNWLEMDLEQWNAQPFPGWQAPATLDYLLRKG